MDYKETLKDLELSITKTQLKILNLEIQEDKNAETKKELENAKRFLKNLEKRKEEINEAIAEDTKKLDKLREQFCMMVDDLEETYESKAEKFLDELRTILMDHKEQYEAIYNELEKKFNAVCEIVKESKEINDDCDIAVIPDSVTDDSIEYITGRFRSEVAEVLNEFFTMRNDSSIPF
jgi:uncharacterized coiled-coil protein SlyX